MRVCRETLAEVMPRMRTAATKMANEEQTKLVGYSDGQMYRGNAINMEPHGEGVVRKGALGIPQNRSVLRTLSGPHVHKKGWIHATASPRIQSKTREIRNHKRENQHSDNWPMPLPLW